MKEAQKTSIADVKSFRFIPKTNHIDIKSSFHHFYQDFSKNAINLLNSQGLYIKTRNLVAKSGLYPIKFVN